MTSNNSITDGSSIEGERAKSDIALNSPFRIFIVLAVVLVAFVIFVMLLGDSRANTDIEPDNMEVFSTGVQQQILPQIPVEEEPEPYEEEANNLEAQNQIVMMRAMEIAEEQRANEQAEMQQRIEAPLFAFKNTASSSEVSQNIAGQDSGLFEQVTNAKTNDSNQALLNASQQPKVEPKIRAEQLKNISTLLAQGTFINAVLESAIDSNLPGMIRAVVNRPIRSFDNKNVLVPAGSRLIGSYQSDVMQGQNRVFIVWDRVLRPDGVSAQLGSIGTDPLGRSGLAGQVDSKFKERFGAAILLSVIDSALQTMANNANQNDHGIQISQNTGISRNSEIALQNSINMKPTISINQGESIRIFVAKDIDFSTVEGWPLQ